MRRSCHLLFLRSKSAPPRAPILSKDAAEAFIEGGAAKSNYDSDWVVRYNTAAVAFMRREGVAVNDLYSLCLEDSHYYKCPDLLHLTEEGYRRCAGQTAQAIREAAKRR